jgi:pyruvate kinase
VKINRLLDAGMDVARLNFSHGSRADHAEVIKTIRQLSEKADRPVAILQDLQGPKIRVGLLKGGSMVLKRGDEVVITTRTPSPSSREIPTTYERLPRDVQPSDRILMDDGLIQLKVLRTTRHEVYCRVIDGGTISDHKGINLPGVRVSAVPLTQKDREDLGFGLEHGVDYVALSFVRGPEDVIAAKKVIAARGVHVPVIAKLEKPAAIRNLDGILAVADGVMVARGDLGVEMSPEEVPMIQKQVIKRANAAKVLVITATQMLESMVSHPRPTRAEASDVANAIFDGTDAVMLSAETASGDYPLESLRMMDRIVREAERGHLHEMDLNRRRQHVALDFPDAISDAAAHVALEIRARAIVVFTHSGDTARLMSKYRPPMPIIAFTPDPRMQHRMCLYWGVIPKVMRYAKSTDHLFSELEKSLLSARLAKKGDTVVVLSGTPPTRRGVTNMMKLHRIE